VTFEVLDSILLKHIKYSDVSMKGRLVDVSRFYFVSSVVVKGTEQ